MNYLINDKGVYGTAPATPGLLNIYRKENVKIVYNKYRPFEVNSKDI